VSEGWIKIHRSMREWRWASEPNMVSLWVHLLINACWEDRNWKGVSVKRGQVIFGRKEWAEKCGITEQSLRTCIERLKSTNEITIESTSKYSIVTVVNYEEYQAKEEESTSQSTTTSTSNQPATNQQLTTSKERKEDKKERIDADDIRAKPVWDFSSVSAEIQKILMPITALPLNTSAVHAWLNAGADPELDIFPTIKVMASRATAPPRSLKYFEGAVLQALAERSRIPDKAQANQNKPKGKPNARHHNFREQDYYARTDGFDVT